MPEYESRTKENIIQKLEYLPFGELWSDKRYSGSWEAPYTFSGKERDSETGFSYFGARYYDSDMNIWLSVDPMLDIYPHQTSYAYCSNNPVNRVDPNGMWDDWYENKNGNAVWDKNVIRNNVPVDGKYIGRTVEYTENGRLYRGNENGEITSTDLTVTIIAGRNNANSSSCNSLSNNSDGVFGLALGTTILSESASSAIKVSEIAGELMPAKVFKVIKAGSKATGVIGSVITTIPTAMEVADNPTKGNITKLIVQGVVIGTAFIPVVGWGISLGVSAADYFFGDKIYNKIDKK